MIIKSNKKITKSKTLYELNMHTNAAERKLEGFTATLTSSNWIGCFLSGGMLLAGFQTGCFHPNLNSLLGRVCTQTSDSL